MKERSKGMARGKLEKLSLRVLCQKTEERHRGCGGGNGSLEKGYNYFRVHSLVKKGTHCSSSKSRRGERRDALGASGTNRSPSLTEGCYFPCQIPVLTTFIIYDIRQRTDTSSILKGEKTCNETNQHIRGGWNCHLS